MWSLERRPDAATHFVADWAELLALSSLDGELSRSDLMTEHRRVSDLDRPDLEVNAISGTDETRAADTFEHLQYRRAAFGDAYPFAVNTEGDLITRLPMSRDRRLYIALLVASAKPWLDRTHHSAIEKNFELLTHHAVAQWLSEDRFAVHLFGTASPTGSRYAGNLPTKLARLAQDLGLVVTPEAPSLPQDQGDGGLDVVAWPIATAETGPDNLRVFVQATTQHSFSSKQADMRHERWRNWINFIGRAAEVVAIPFCYRSPTGEWYDRRDLTTILLDRVRLTSLLAASDVDPPLLDMVVEAAISQV